MRRPALPAQRKSLFPTSCLIEVDRNGLGSVAEVRRQLSDLFSHAPQWIKEVSALGVTLD
jgi:hypothetical protein